MFGWLCFSLVTSRVSPRRATYFLSAKPKESKQRKGEPRPCRFAVPCATRSVRGTCKLASLAISTPLNRLRRFPLQGTTPAARQSRFRGAPGRGFASLAGEGACHCASWATTRVAPTTSLLIPHSTPVIAGLTRNLSPPANAPRKGTARRALTFHGGAGPRCASS